MFEDLWRFPGTDVFNQLDSFRQVLDTVLSDGQAREVPEPLAGGGWPKVNIGETDDAVTVYAFVPGMAREDIEVTVEGNLLVLAGRREPQAAGEKLQIHRRERFVGEFRRVVTLPDSLDPEQVEASYRDGVLAVRIARRAEQQPRRIEINVA